MSMFAGIDAGSLLHHKEPHREPRSRGAWKSPQLMRGPLASKKTLELMETERLELIPATTAFCDAETRGRAALEACLGARVPASWPPPVFEPDDVVRIRKQLEANSTIGSW